MVFSEIIYTVRILKASVAYATLIPLELLRQNDSMTKRCKLATAIHIYYIKCIWSFIPME